MKRQPRTLGAYADCKRHMDLALEHNGLRMKFARGGAARRFRQRCYQFRALLSSKSEEEVLPGELPSTPYDQLIIRMDPMNAKSQEPCELHFVFRGSVDAVLLDLEGNPIEDAEEPKKEDPFDGLDIE